MAGIMFQDITTLLLDPKAFKDTIDLFVERYKGKNISVVAGKPVKNVFFFSFFPFVLGLKRFINFCNFCGVRILIKSYFFGGELFYNCD